MTIQEQLNAINATFVKLHKDFVRFEAEKKSLASRFSLEYSRVQQKWDQERSRVSAVKEDVLKYYRIAKDNSSKELVSSGVGGQRPDIARLNRMIEQINSYNRNDPVAGQIIDLASQYIVYLDRTHGPPAACPAPCSAAGHPDHRPYSSSCNLRGTDCNAGSSGNAPFPRCNRSFVSSRR